MLTVRSVTGLLELDESAECDLGVAPSFWIAVALTYLDFLEDREVRSTQFGSPLWYSWIPRVIWLLRRIEPHPLLFFVLFVLYFCAS